MRKILIPLFAAWFVLAAAFPALASPIKAGPFLICGPCASNAPDKIVEVKFDSDGVGSVSGEMEVFSQERVAEAVYKIVGNFHLLEFLPETKIYIYTDKAGHTDAGGLYYTDEKKIALLPRQKQEKNWFYDLLYDTTVNYLCHEIGHLVEDLYFSGSEFREYRKIRGIPDDWRETGEWKKRPGEVFAEDFRYIFEPNAFKAPNRTALDLTPEKEAAVKDYILEVITKKINAQARVSR